MTLPLARGDDRPLAILWLALGAIAAAWLLPLSATWKLSPDLGHAWVVPLLMAYLWWERWNERPGLTSSHQIGWMAWVVALGFAAAHLPLRLLLTPFPLWPSLLAAYTLLLAALAIVTAWLLAGRSGVRWIAGPLVLLLSTLPIPNIVETATIMPLRQTWASLAAEVCNWLGIPALALGTSVRIGTGWVGIDEACGGIRSLQACVMIGLFLGEWYRFPLARRAALLIAAIAVALLGNFARVLFLSTRASVSVEAVESAHDTAGWISMAASLLLTAGIACRWGRYQWPAQRITVRPPARLPRTLVLWIAIVGATLVANELITRAWFHRGGFSPTRPSQWSAQFPESHWSFRPTPLAKLARDLLQPDLFRAGSWRDASDTRVAAYYIEWTKGQQARSIPFLHNPTICLPLAGCELIAPLDPIMVELAGVAVPFHTYKFRQSGEDILVAFTIWDPSRGQPLQASQTTSSWLAWWSHQWSEVAEARIHQPGQLLTITRPWTDDAATATRDLLLQVMSETR